MGVRFSRVYEADADGYELYCFVGEVGLDVLESYLGRVALVPRPFLVGS